jgi:hypothetical protein
MNSTQHGHPRFPRWRPSAGTWRGLARWLLPTPGSLILIASLIWGQSAGALPLVRQAVPASPSTTTVHYQGRLADSGGEPLEGPVDLQFALYASDTEGEPIWGPELHEDVPVEDGLFTVNLGGPTGGLPLSLLGGSLWLEVIVEGEALSPRQQLGAVPYAMQALTVPDGAITSEKLALTHWRLRDEAELSWQTALDGQFVAVPGLGFSYTAPVDGAILLSLTTALQHTTAGAEAQCGVGVDGENPTARGAVYLPAAGHDNSCSVQFLQPVSAGQTYDFDLMVLNATPGSLTVRKGEFTQLTAVFFGSP